MSSTRVRESLELRARVESGIAQGEELVAAHEVLKHAESGYLAMAGDGWPYLVPLCFAYDKNDIHFHCGGGLTASLLAADDRACFAVATTPQFVRGAAPWDDTVFYESVLAFGRVRLLDDDAAREAALRSIVAKYDAAAQGESLRSTAFNAVLVYTLEVEALTYRTRRAR